MTAPEPEIVAVLTRCDAMSLRRVMAHAAGLLASHEGIDRTADAASRIVAALKRQAVRGLDA
jgi:hypothetical protein